MTLPDLTQLTLLAVEAVRTGDAATLRRALDLGVAVDVRPPPGDSLLMLACDHGHVEAARLLLDYGANIDAPAGDGRTALMRAAASHRVEMVRWLLAHGADPSLRDAAGARAVDIATGVGAADVVSLLIA